MRDASGQHNLVLLDWREAQGRHVGCRIRTASRTASLYVMGYKDLYYMALLHKSGDWQASSFPRQTYPTASVTGMPSAV